MNPNELFKSKDYLKINEARLNHLDSLSLPINNKKVLEVGAGVGDLTDYFYGKNCHVTCTEVRDENINIIKERFYTLTICNELSVLKMDIDNPINFEDKFDIVFCYGLLYHLSNPKSAIKYMRNQLNDNGILLLETCVSFGDEMLVNNLYEPKNNPTQSFEGIGCRPTRSWVYNELKNNFEFVYLPKKQPNHYQFPKSFLVENKNDLNRSIFIASRKEINNELLTEKLIKVYE